MSDLKQISLVLGGGEARTANELFKTDKQKEIAEEKLYDLIERDQHLHEIMVSHAATRDVLREIYQALLKSGAGQWMGGHWVPASALAFETTLDFVLTTQSAKQIVGVAAWTHVAFILIDYFEKGGVGPIRSQPLPI